MANNKTLILLIIISFGLSGFLFNANAINNIIISPNSFSVPIGSQISQYNATTGVTSFRQLPVGSGGSVSLSCLGIGDLTIYHNGTSEMLIDKCGNILGSGTYQSSDGALFTQAMNLLAKGGHLYYGKGQYRFSNINLSLPTSVVITGDNYDSHSYDGDYGTTFLLGNNASILLNSFDVIEYLDIDCTTKSDTSECVFINPSSYGTMNHVYVYGNPHNLAMHLAGTPTGIVSSWDFDKVTLVGGLWGMRMDHATNNDFKSIWLNGFQSVGLAMFNSDNNLFTKIMINGKGTTANTDIMFGNAANDGTGDNVFTQATLSVGDINFVSNAVFNSTNSKDIRPNQIFMVSIDGCVNTVYNNHSQGQVAIAHTAYSLCNGK